MKELYETKVIFYKNSKELSKLKAQFKSLNITEFREIKNKNLQLQLKLKKYNEILHSFRLHTQIQPLDSKQLEPIVQLHESLKNILINNNLIESNET